MPTAAPKNTSYAMGKRLSAAKMHEFTLVDSFKLGYRAREEVTMLNPSVLVTGSQNVMTSTTGRVGIVKGYALDGPSSLVIAPIVSSFDFHTAKGNQLNLRAGFLTSAGNDGKLQFRTIDANGDVQWIDLITGLSLINFNGTEYWDTVELLVEALLVNGGTVIYEWTGATTTFASATSNSITKQGTSTWTEEGFYVSITGSPSVVIGTTSFVYTGGTGTTTLTGVTPDPTGYGFAAGALVYQGVKQTPVSSVTALVASSVMLIGCLDNQVYYGTDNSNNWFVSKINNYKDCSFTAGGRLIGEGARGSLGSPIVGFIPQEDKMYASAGKDEWYQSVATLSSDNKAEAFSFARLKTAALQAAQSQAFMGKDKNSVIFVSNEPVVSSLGPVADILQSPQIVDVSYPIINDMNQYDFTDGSIYYWKNFVFVAVPKHSLVRIYNMTDPKYQYWEAPVMYPISRFYEVGGNLYGHSYLVSESYKLFQGYNFKGNVIDARAVFAYNQYGSRFATKSFNEFYYEGRMTQNGTLNLNLNYETDGFQTSKTFPLKGDSKWVAITGGVNGLGNSLGKSPLGKQPLGGMLGSPSLEPPKFRKIKTMIRTSFYEQQTGFSSVEKDFDWSIICFGGAASPTAEGNNSITD